MAIQTSATACPPVERTEAADLFELVAPAPKENTAARVLGEVVACREGGFEVKSSGRIVAASKAVSCLIEPETGDEVALLISGKSVFITDVLQRPDRSAKALAISLRNAEGARQDLVLSAANVTIEADDKVQVSGRDLGFRFEAIMMSGKQIAMVGQKLLTSMQDIVNHAKKLMATYEISTTRAQNRIDRVIETDQLRAGSIQSQADTVSITQSGSSLIVAEEDVRMDGKRITMG